MLSEEENFRDCCDSRWKTMKESNGRNGEHSQPLHCSLSANVDGDSIFREIFFVDSDVNGSTKQIWEEEFFAYFPVSLSQIHLPVSEDDDVKPSSESYERRLLSAFPGVGLFAGDSIPRFDLVLLDVEEQGEISALRRDVLLILSTMRYSSYSATINKLK